MENATALTGTGAKPVVPEPAFFALLLQELGFSGVENLETFCLKTLCPGETLPAVPWHGSLFFSAGMLPDAGYSLVPAGASASPDAGYSLVPAGASASPDAELPLPPAAGKQPFLPTATSNCESELQQKISLPLENSGTTTPDLKTPGSDHSGTSRLLHGESGKPPLGELTDFFLRHGEKKQIPSGQIPSGQAVPERVVPAAFSAYGGVPQQDLSWFPGGSTLLQPENVLEQVLVKIQHFARPGTEELQIKLYPETLGEMKVKVRSEHGALVAEITVSHAGVKELLDGHLDLLRQRFKQLNLTVDVINVLVEYNGQEGPPSQGEKEPLFFNQDRMMIEDSGSSRSGVEQQTALVFACGVGINVLA